MPYNLYGAEIENYFEGLEQDVECPATPPILLNSPNTRREGLNWGKRNTVITYSVLPRPLKNPHFPTNLYSASSS